MARSHDKSVHSCADIARAILSRQEFGVAFATLAEMPLAEHVPMSHTSAHGQNTRSNHTGSTLPKRGLQMSKAFSLERTRPTRAASSGILTNRLGGILRTAFGVSERPSIGAVGLQRLTTHSLPHGTSARAWCIRVSTPTAKA